MATRTKKTARGKPAARAKAKSRAKARAYASIAGTFEMLLAPHAKAVRDLAARLRTLIRESLPDAEEDVRGSARSGVALYSIGGHNRIVCGIQPSAKGCLLSVHYVDADDSSSLALKDEGSHVVHIRFHSINRDQEAALSALVRLARERMLA